MGKSKEFCFQRGSLGKLFYLLPVITLGSPGAAIFLKLHEYRMTLGTWARKGILGKGSEDRRRVMEPMSRVAIVKGCFLAPPLHSDIFHLVAARAGIMSIHWPGKEAGSTEPTLSYCSHGPQGLLPICSDRTFLCLFSKPPPRVLVPCFPAAFCVALPTWGPPQNLCSGA